MVGIRPIVFQYFSAKRIYFAGNYVLPSHPFGSKLEATYATKKANYLHGFDFFWFVVCKYTTILLLTKYLKFGSISVLAINNFEALLWSLKACTNALGIG